MQVQNPNTKLITAIGVCFFTANFALKLATNALTNISGDEPFSVCLSQFPVTTICRIIFEGNNPPLHELLLHYFTQIFGTSPTALRALPCAFSSITACLIFLIGYKLHNLRTGIVAALLFSFSSFNLSIAHLCRAYALVGMLSALSMFVFLLYLDTRRMRTLFLLALINAFGFYAHYFGVWITAVQLVYLFFEKRSIKEKAFPLTCLMASWLVLVLPSLYFFAKRLTVVAQHNTWIKPVTSVESIYNLFWSFSNMPVAAVICLLLLTVAVLWYSLKKNATTVAFRVVFLWLFLPVGFTFLTSFYKGFFLDTYLNFTSPAFYLLVALGATIIADRFSSPVSIVALAVPVAFMLFTFQIQKAGVVKSEIQTAVNFIDEHNQKNVLALVCPNWFDKNYAYYSTQNLITDYTNFEITGSDIRLKSLRSNLRFIENINEANIDTSYNQVIYLDYNANFHYPNNQVENYLKSNYKTVKQIDLNSSALKLSVYSNKQ